MMGITTSHHATLFCSFRRTSSHIVDLKPLASRLAIKRKRYQSGLSLVEVLVSLSVLVLIGIVATSSLQQAIRLSDTIEARSQKLQRLQSLQSLLRSDLESSIHIYHPEQYQHGNAFNYPLWYKSQKLNYNIVLAGRQARPFIGNGAVKQLIIEDFFYSFEKDQLVRHYKRRAKSPWAESIIPIQFQSFSVERLTPAKNELSATSVKTRSLNQSSTAELQAKMLMIKWASKDYGEMTLWSIEP